MKLIFDSTNPRYVSDMLRRNGFNACYDLNTVVGREIHLTAKSSESADTLRYAVARLDSSAFEVISRNG